MSRGKKIISGLVIALLSLGVVVTNFTGEDIDIIAPCVTESGEISQDTFLVSKNNDILKHPTKTYKALDLDLKVNLVLHNSAGNKKATIADLSRIHVVENGWPKLSYHIGINYLGQVLLINELDLLTYHARGNNTVSIGILMIGNYELEKPSEEMMNSVEIVVNYLKNELGIENVTIHNRIPRANTLCPGKFAEEALEDRKIIPRILKRNEL